MANTFVNLRNTAIIVDTSTNLPGGVEIGSLGITKDTQDLYVYDGTTWQLKSGGGGGGGITSLNGRTAASQTLVTGTSGTNFNISSAGSIHTFNLPVADATHTGKLSSSDWTTFNNKLSSVPFPLLGPDGSASSPTYGFASDIAQDTGMHHPGDGQIAFSTDGVDRFEINNSGVVVHGTAKIDSHGATGNSGTFAGIDGTDGTISDITGWSFQGDGSSSSYVTRQVPVDAGTVYQSIHSKEVEITSSQNNSDYNYNAFNLDSHIDRSANNHDFLGTYNVVNISDTIEGTGNMGDHRTHNSHQNLGTNGAGTAQNCGHFQINSNINSGYTVNNFDSIYTSLNNQGTITNNARAFRADFSGTVGQDFEGFGVNTSINAGRNTTLISVNNSGTVANQFRFLEASNNNTINSGIGINAYNNSAVTTDWTGLNITNGGSVGTNYSGINTYSNGNITGSSTTIGGYSDGSVGGDRFLLNLGANNTGSVGGNSFLINAYDNSAITGGFQGMNLNRTGNVGTYMNGLSINLSGNATSAQGLSVNVGSVSVSGGVPTAINSDGGTTQVNYGYAFPSSVGFFQSHYLGGSLQVQSGIPISNTYGFGENLAQSVIFEDDMGDDGTGIKLGINVVGMVGQLQGTSGKTLDALTFCLTGAGVPASSTGGTISNLTMYRAAGLLPQGGTIDSVTNMYGFKVDALADLTPAMNQWGVYVDSANSDNFFKKNVIIGGATGKPTGTEVLYASGNSIITGTGSFKSDDIQFGTPDPFSRIQVWNKATDSVLRLGSWGQDGDSANTTSEGIVVYGDSLTGQPISGSDGGYARVKRDMFGLFTVDSTLPAYNGGDYYYRADTNGQYFKDDSGNKSFEIARTTGKITSLADTIRIKTAKTPANASDTGNQGDIAWDSDYVYVCVATDTWKRSPITTW